MRNLILFLFIILLIIASNLKAQSYLSLDSNNWIIKNRDGKIQPINITEFDNKECIHLSTRDIAYYSDSTLENFELEMDIAGSIIPGIGFRGLDERNFEYVYLRVISDNQNDAIQYLPVYNGGFSWQLYNYPDYESSTCFPKKYLYSIDRKYNIDLQKGILSEDLRRYLNGKDLTLKAEINIHQLDSLTWKIFDFENKKLLYLVSNSNAIDIYSGLTWIHFKVEVIDEKASIYVEDMVNPKLIVNNLKHKIAPGYITLRNYFSDSYYSNIKIERITPTETKEREFEIEFPSNYITDWVASERFIRNDSLINYQIDSVLNNTQKWISIQPELNRIINLSSHYNETSGTVLLKTIVQSDTDIEKELLFDYANHLIISLNSEVVFSNSINYRNNEGRVFDGEEKVDISLKKGSNQLIFVITPDTYHQNWGFIAKIKEH